jgi:hypothetical protein
MTRPPIPEPLRRRVLLEAGHRCAIPTCLHPAVDVHHITPWERCLEHTFENLIALCPNCHRRADRGEIDRISLLSYKARVASIWTTGSVPAAMLEQSAATPSWSIATLKDKHSPHPAYNIAFDYPVFSTSVGQHAAELNALIYALVLSDVNEMRGLELSPWASETPEEGKWNESDLAGSFQVTLDTTELVSIRFPVYRYGAGAAHPNHYTRCLSFQSAPGIQLGLGHLFRDLREALPVIAAFCADALGEMAKDEVWRTGVEPIAENFDIFNLTTEGLLITFSEYQVGPYIAGEPTVVVPWGILANHVSANCAISPIQAYLGQGCLNA